MSSATEAELLAEILRSPHDLGPRRVLADLLMQRDDPRGELIQIQCAERRKPALDAREAELLKEHAERWLPKLGKLVTKPVFRRGFVEQVTTTCITFIAHGAEIVKLVPLRAVRITGVSRVQDVERLLALPAMRQIRDLQLEASNRLGKAHCRVLAASPILAQLDLLALPNGTIGDTGAEALASSPHLANLTELRLRNCAIEPAGAEALANARLTSLRVLDLSLNHFSARGAHPIVSSTTLVALADLDLSSCTLGRQGGEIVAGPSARAPFLERLRLSANKLDDSNARQLAGATHFKKLRSLSLVANAITAVGAKALLKATLPALQELVVNANEIPPELMGQLAVRFPHS